MKIVGIWLLRTSRKILHKKVTKHKSIYLDKSSIHTFKANLPQTLNYGILEFLMIKPENANNKSIQVSLFKKILGWWHTCIHVTYTKLESGTFQGIYFDYSNLKKNPFEKKEGTDIISVTLCSTEILLFLDLPKVYPKHY